MQQEGDPGPINDMVNALDVYKHPYSMLTSDEIERKYPGIRNNNGQKHVGLYDPNGTMLIPSRCLKVIQVRRCNTDNHGIQVWLKSRYVWIILVNHDNPGVQIQVSPKGATI